MKSRSEKENYRLTELDSFEILQTDHEPEFDEILFTASVLCKASRGYISFVDHESMWFKAVLGVDKKSIPRQMTLADAYIFSDGIDTELRNDIFKRALGFEKLTFFLEVPIVTPSGEVLGTLAVFDEEAKEFTEDLAPALKIVAKQIVHLLELKKLNRKTRSVGEMTNEIAHELNNPLSIIMGSTEHLSRKIQQDQFDKASMLKITERINVSAVRIERIIKSMKQFSRTNDKDQYEEVSIHQLVLETVDLFEEKFIKNGIGISVHIPVDVIWFGNPIRLSQVLFNLINNASQALEELAEKWIRVEASVSAQGYLVISVTDSGPGIPLELANKIMKPFFTTKASSKGTGLGLSICKDIIESYKGELTIDHAFPNTRFLIKLPLGG